MHVCPCADCVFESVGTQWWLCFRLVRWYPGAAGCSTHTRIPAPGPTTTACMYTPWGRGSRGSFMGYTCTSVLAYLRTKCSRLSIVVGLCPLCTVCHGRIPDISPPGHFSLPSFFHSGQFPSCHCPRRKIPLPSKFTKICLRWEGNCPERQLSGYCYRLNNYLVNIMALLLKSLTS